MRKAAVLLLSTATVMMVVGVLITQSLLVLQRVAAVESVQGIVWLRQHGHGDFVPLADRARIGAGDVLKTGDRAQVDLHWVDDTRMRVGPNSLVTVLKSHYNVATKADTEMFKLDLGRVWIRILKVLSQKSKFEIITPTATAGVRGTVFSVEVEPDGKTLVSVKEGKVAVASGQAHQDLPAGSMSAAGAVQPLNPGERDLWQENADVTGPYLLVKQPLAGAKVRPGASLEVSGVAEPGAVVTVNGQPQTLKLQKLFSTTVTAPGKPGRLEVTCEAKDRRGLVTRRVVAVEVTP
jgi:hypothetical protein